MAFLKMRALLTRLRLPASLAALSLLFSAARCTNTSNTSNSWNQNRGDIANTDQMLAGPSDRALGTTATVFIGKTAVNMSPVIDNQGNVFVSIADGSGSGPGNALVKLSGGSAPAILNKLPLTGLISTPAVDESGNVYVSVRSEDGSARVVGLTSSLGPVFDTPIPGHVATIGPPKLFKFNNQMLIFVIIGGGDPAGGHLFMFDRGGEIIGNVWFCGDVTSTEQVLPIALNPGHGVAIRRAQADGQVYLVAAADFCGVRQILLTPGAKAGEPPVLTPQKIFYDNDSDKLFWDPVITGEDQVLLVTSRHNDTFWMRAYDLATGDEKWKQSLANWLSDSPALAPFQVNSAYGVQMPTDSQPGELLKFDLGSAGNVAPPAGVDNSASAIAIAGQKIFVVTKAAIQVFDLNLNPKAVVPFAGLSPLAVGVDGAVYGVDAKGTMFRIGP
jgi:hypothetical protein